MPVVVATDGTVIERDRVYIVPPSVAVTLAKGTMSLAERPPNTLPIDAALR